MNVHIFGIRHHGPGCSRALQKAFCELAPDIVLVEGPPEGNDIFSFVDHCEMKPPVALLVYPEDKPDSAVFYPFASFSPEWNAIQYAVKNSIPVRFMDFPLKYRFAMDRQNAANESEPESDSLPPEEDDSGEENTSESLEPQSEILQAESREIIIPPEWEIRLDPIGFLARVAGYPESEKWWDRVIEQSEDSEGIFTGIMEAMSALRQKADEFEKANQETQAESPIPGLSMEDLFFASQYYEPYREASMRQAIRQALTDGFQKIAVVCGAWHAPVLQLETTDPYWKTAIPVKKADTVLLAKLPKVKTAVTWCPWTYSRLAERSGYRAGVESPGWYQHLWQNSDTAVPRWMVRAADTLRREGLDVAPASVIEAVRLAGTLAALRERTAPSLDEVRDAILTVFCSGNTVPMEFIRIQLEIGFELGSVPDSVPVVPLYQDIQSEQKRLRLKVTSEIKKLDLDLRDERDRDKSRLFHRLNLLNIPWGSLASDSNRSKGTFHEIWEVAWNVEFVVRIIESSIYGCTLKEAAGRFVLEEAKKNPSLAPLTVLLEEVLPAELDTTILDALLDLLRNEAAVSSDFSSMIQALPPLVNIIHYGDVRQTRLDHLEPVFDGLFERVLIGLIPGCVLINEEMTEQRIMELETVQTSLELLNSEDRLREWFKVLYQLALDDRIPALLRGRATRFLFERKELEQDELVRRIQILAGPGVDAMSMALWMEGFLKGSGQVILCIDSIWTILNYWICSLNTDMFMEMAALLRRAFTYFTGPELKKMGAKIKNLTVDTLGENPENLVTEEKQKKESMDFLDENRIRKIIPVLEDILKP